ncbi:hypothetical protein SPHV1_420025 [Novosphingobium sp. KN65.2]|nr:hypothetical protein SPHV1_420025 [Novosphingobium sp. KN65.2]
MPEFHQDGAIQLTSPDLRIGGGFGPTDGLDPTTCALRAASLSPYCEDLNSRGCHRLPR